MDRESLGDGSGSGDRSIFRCSSGDVIFLNLVYKKLPKMMHGRLA